MAHILVRFPHLAESIFQELDNLSLFHCQTAARSCVKFIEQSKLYYIRKIKHYTNCKNDTLKKMLYRSDVNLKHYESRSGYILSFCKKNVIKKEVSMLQ